MEDNLEEQPDRSKTAEHISCDDLLNHKVNQITYSSIFHALRSYMFLYFACNFLSHDLCVPVFKNLSTLLLVADDNLCVISFRNST